MSEQYLVEEFLYSSCNKVKRNNGGYVMRCPICGDSKKNPNKRRCHVDYYSKYDEWIYTCYNGGCPEPSGNIQSLYSHVMGVSWKEANKALNETKYDANKIKQKLTKKEVFVDEEDETNNILDLDLNDCLSLNQVPSGRIQQKYHKLLLKFFVDRYIPLRRNIMICHSGKYKNRFIIPVYENGEMIYFQGRSINNDIQPKYLNPDVIKENVVLNKESFDPEKFIIVSEGLIDAFMVEDDQGTTCLGASVSDEFLEKIVPLSRKGVIIALDNPNLDESGFNNYKKLLEKSKYSKKLKYFFMPLDGIKDLNDLRLSDTGMDVYNFIVNNSLSHFKSSIIMKQSL